MTAMNRSPLLYTVYLRGIVLARFRSQADAEGWAHDKGSISWGLLELRDRAGNVLLSYRNQKLEAKES